MYIPHLPDEFPQLLPVGLDLLLQDVVLGNLLFQLGHAGPVPALAHLLLQKELGVQLSPSHALPASPCGGAESVVWAEGGQARRAAQVNGRQLTPGDMLPSGGPG